MTVADLDLESARVALPGHRRPAWLYRWLYGHDARGVEED